MFQYEALGEIFYPYSRACGYYLNFLDRRLLLKRKLLNQEFLVVEVIKFYSHDLVDRYLSVSQITTDMFLLL
jgi:hypothetical protein